MANIGVRLVGLSENGFSLNEMTMKVHEFIIRSGSTASRPGLGVGKGGKG
jgi:hypothetical protein